MIRSNGLLFTAAVVAAVTATLTGTLIWSHGAEAGALDVRFAILDNDADAGPEPQLARADRTGTQPDLSKLRVVTNNRGRFGSRVVIAPAQDGHSVCYALLGGRPTDPAMSYCYAPNGSGLPELIGGQFKPSALESIIEGRPSVQLFGIAADTVESIRVEVAGRWRPVSVARNGFYLDLPGIARDQLGIAEAALSNGAVQRYNLQSGSYE